MDKDDVTNWGRKIKKNIQELDKEKLNEYGNIISETVDEKYTNFQNKRVIDIEQDIKDYVSKGTDYVKNGVKDNINGVGDTFLETTESSGNALYFLKGRESDLYA